MNDMKTVDYVDLNRYMGTWYEIAKIPNRFQKKCIGNTTANYTMNEYGDVRVVNSCLEQDGKINTAKGLARSVDMESNSKLKVSFFGIFGFYLFWGNYWILYLDENYENVVVGEPDRKYAWILSRKEELTKSDLEPIYKVLVENGYNPEDFEKTEQGITN